MNARIWITETRPQFLLLSLVLGFYGTSVAFAEDGFHLGHALLATLGVLLAHISVNTLNDYFDFKSGIDTRTERTPFSGGSGVLPSGGLSAAQVLWLGLGALLLAAPIGVYFAVVKGWLLVPLLAAATLCVLLYTPLLLKVPFPEWSAGLGLGLLPILGFYFAQAGGYSWSALVAAVPAGILVHNLLFINELPDVEADRAGGRRTTPVMIGQQRSAVVYTVLTGLVYAWIVAFVLAGTMPIWALLALLTLPLAIKASRGALAHRNVKELVPALGANVAVVMLTQLLLGAGYLIDGLVG
ncbi:MAG: prenyltransferase [Polyangia bacterium]